MVIYIGADHRGFELKTQLATFIKEVGYTVVDLGNDQYDESDDYVDIAARLAGRVSVEYETSRGMLICGSGVGVDVVANKFPNVRSVLASSANQAFDARNDDDVNVLCLGANYLDFDAAKKIVIAWLETPFGGEERYKRRIQKIIQLETKLIERLEHDRDEAEERIQGIRS